MHSEITSLPTHFLQFLAHFPFRERPCDKYYLFCSIIITSVSLIFIHAWIGPDYERFPCLFFCIVSWQVWSAVIHRDTGCIAWVIRGDIPWTREKNRKQIFFSTSRSRDHVKVSCCNHQLLISTSGLTFCPFSLPFPTSLSFFMQREICFSFSRYKRIVKKMIYIFSKIFVLKINKNFF